MRYFLFILANALLFIRPSELIADLSAVEIYRWFILACLAVSLPTVLQQITLRFTGVPPIVTCVVLLLPAVFLSGLFHGNSDLIQDTVTEYAKILIYFLLLVSLVTDLPHLRSFLRWIALFSAAVTLVAVLRYHADIALPAAPPKTSQADKQAKDAKDVNHGTFVVDKVRDPATGQMIDVQRMCGTGIFNDPNDFALILITAIPLCLYWLTDPVYRATRPFWLLLLFFFGYALMLTHSRGGLLALLAGLGVLVHLKFGSKKTILFGALCLPALLAVFAGRMTDFSTDEGTGQTRIQLWSDGLMFFQQSPLFGIGMDNFRQFSSHVAHHSFIHAFTELGIIGGTLFLGAFYFALKGIYDLRRGPVDSQSMAELDPELRRLHPFLMGTLVAYAVGICFLSRCYIVPTYLVLGLAVVYLRLHAKQFSTPRASSSFFVWPRLAGISCGFLIASYTFVRVFVNWR
jgi:O-Antigen ligase